MCKVYHRNRKFRSTSLCVLLICSFNSAADMHSFPQSSQVFTLPDNAYFSCAHSTQRKICTFSHRNRKFSLYITMCTFDMLIQLRGRYEIFPTEFTNQSNHLTEKRYALFSTEFTLFTLFAISISHSNLHHTLHFTSTKRKTY